MRLRGERFHNYPVNPLFGVQSDLPHLMTQTQQVNDSTDAELTSRGSAISWSCASAQRNALPLALLERVIDACIAHRKAN